MNDDFELKPPPINQSYDERRRELERRAKTIDSDEGVLFNESSWNLVLDLVSDGFTIDEINDNPDLPSWSTVRKWINSDPARREQYRVAKELSADSYESQLLGLTRFIENKDDVPAARLKSDNLKWVMARRAPKVYGDPKLVTDTTPVEQEKMEIKGGLPEMPM